MKYNHLSRLSLSSLAFILVACGATMAQETEPSEAHADATPSETQPPSTPTRDETFARVRAAMESKAAVDQVDEETLERQRLQKELQRNQQIRNIHSNPEGALKRAVQQLYQLNSSGVVTEADFELADQRKAAQKRVRLLTQYLTHDLNGDLELSREEVDLSLRDNKRGDRATFELAFMNDDDGLLSIPEILELVKNENTRNTRRLSQRENLQMFDLNGDGTINSQEISDAIDAIVAEPMPERVNYRTLKSQPKPSCQLPAPSENAEPVIVTGYKGTAVSTVSAGGPDTVTEVARLIIEEGDKPLYIYASAHGSTIWKLSGATNRVEKFIVQPGSNRKGPGAGVVGLPENIVSFVKPGTCGSYANSPADGKAHVLKAGVKKGTGREVSKLIAHKALAEISVPSGTVKGKGKVNTQGPRISTPSGDFYMIDGKPVAIDQKDVTFSNMAFAINYPGGVIKIDAKKVVSPAPVEDYEVLPVQAGLHQLMESGHLTRTPDGYFQIEKPIPHFPAGLAGAFSTKFILKTGVEMPSGSPGHSSVVSEETGECLTRMRCR